MRSVTTVYRKDGTPIPVVTIENDRGLKPPLPSPDNENKYKMEKLVQNNSNPFAPRASNSEPDK
jgi:hypothetical protein